MKIGFDNDKYLKMQSEHIRERINHFDNKLYLEFEVDGSNLSAIWQPGDNYGVWQKCGYCGDDYSGYLLFPTYGKNEYFCLKYSC